MPLYVGSRVTLYNDVDIDSKEGTRVDVQFCDYVTQYSQETGLLRFEESDVGLAKFREMVSQADGVEIIMEYER